MGELCSKSDSDMSLIENLYKEENVLDNIKIPEAKLDKL